MSIRLRLTLLYTAILAVTLIAFSTTLYVTQTQATYNGIKANLMRQVSFFTNNGERAPGLPPAQDAGAPVPNLSLIHI